MRKYILLFLLIGLTSVKSCRKDPPPIIELCELKNGVGFCDLKDGTQKKRLPSEMNHYRALPYEDMDAYVKWCYYPEPTPSTIVTEDKLK